MIARHPPNSDQSAGVLLSVTAAAPSWCSWNFHLVSASASSLVWVALAGSKGGHLLTILVVIANVTSHLSTTNQPVCISLGIISDGFNALYSMKTISDKNMESARTLTYPCSLFVVVFHLLTKSVWILELPFRQGMQRLELRKHRKI